MHMHIHHYQHQVPHQHQSLTAAADFATLIFPLQASLSDESHLPASSEALQFQHFPPPGKPEIYYPVMYNKRTKWIYII